MIVTTAETALGAFVDELHDLVGAEHVSTDLAAREKASADWAKMSPILEEQLPLGLADVVVWPPNADVVAPIVALAVRHGVPVTPRGKGTGNYGQGIPMRGGVVLDLSRATAIVAVGEGTITAEAGARMTTLESSAREHDQQLWIYPSTSGSSIGGFLAGGSGGTGTIAHGSNMDGFVVSVDVALADGRDALVTVSGDDVQPYLHAYGVTGVIARTTVRLEPIQDWRGLYCSFGTFEEALQVLRPLGALTPRPRLVSADVPTVVAALPKDPAYPPGRASLRAIVDVDALDAATALVEQGGGRVEAVREGPTTSAKISSLSYNHPTWHLQKTSPGTYFHIEVGGDALIDRYDEVNAVYEDSMLHIEAGHKAPIGMLNGRYRSPQQVYDGIDRLRELGVGVHSPHQWYVDRNVESVKKHAAKTDPTGILNPGKLV
ncbi:FAD-binding oxidoreductase [Actinomycetes bacterium M1A6_2h]